MKVNVVHAHPAADSYLASLHRRLLRGLKATCGGLGVKHLYLAQHSVYDISPEARERFARKVEERFARF